MKKVLPPGCAEATARLLVAAGVLGAAPVRWSRSRTVAAIYRSFDWMLPGQFAAFAYRKAFCQRQAEAGIAAGASQVLVLGAGYDTLGWRLAPEYPGVGFFEIDQPGTARLKARGIERLGPRPNLHLVAEDLGERKLVDVLGGHAAWNRAAKTVIIAEGLLMYLPAAAVRDLFAQVAAITGRGSRIAFTYIGTGADGRPDAGPWTGLFLWSLKVAGEPWHWSIRPEELGPFLAGLGWQAGPDPASSGERRGVEYLALAQKEM